VYLVARVERDPEEWVAQVPVDDFPQGAAGLADTQCPVPLGYRLEIRSYKALDVVRDARRQLFRAVDHEAGPAVERAHTPNPTVNRSPVRSDGRRG